MLFINKSYQTSYRSWTLYLSLALPSQRNFSNLTYIYSSSKYGLARKGTSNKSTKKQPLPKRTISAKGHSSVLTTQESFLPLPLLDYNFLDFLYLKENLKWTVMSVTCTKWKSNVRARRKKRLVLVFWLQDICIPRQIRILNFCTCLKY